LSIEEVVGLLERFPRLRSINLGTGENGLHPDLDDALGLFFSRGLKVGLTSNGYTVEILTDEVLRQFHDVDFSMDFPDRRGQDAFRGAGVYDRLLVGIQRCKGLGVESSLVMTLMSINWSYVEGMLLLARDLDVNLRINVYKPVWGHEFSLSYEQFWSSVEFLSGKAAWVSCSEPLVSIATGFAMDGPPCGRGSLRITPEAYAVPCVYAPSDGDFRLELASMSDDDLEVVSARFHRIPRACLQCQYVKACQGGCAARRLYTSGLDSPDPYCPLLMGQAFPKFNITRQQHSQSLELVHSGYLCTIIVR